MDRRTALRKTAIIAGSTAMVPSLFSLLQSCKEQTRLDWQPTILSMEQAGMISALVDTILPKTTTPGGLDMKVDIFIDLVINKMFDEAGQQAIIGGITSFDADCTAKYGDPFRKLNPEERAAFLTEKEKDSGKFNGKVWGTAVGVQKPVGFYRTIKSLALWGYFTSEEIGKNVLSYDPIPGVYLGCIPRSDVGNSWSL